MSKKILLCDDDQAILDVMKIMLEQNGYEVEVVNNGGDIQNKVKSSKPDLIMLDIWMPGSDGKEVTKILKEDNISKDIPIVIISALNEKVEDIKSLGADDFLGKPFEMKELLEVAAKYTQK